LSGRDTAGRAEDRLNFIFPPPRQDDVALVVETIQPRINLSVFDLFEIFVVSPFLFVFDFDV